MVEQPAISNVLLSMSRNAVYSLHSPGKFPSANTGVFVQRSGQHNVLLVVDA